MGLLNRLLGSTSTVYTVPDSINTNEESTKPSLFERAKGFISNIRKNVKDSVMSVLNRPEETVETLEELAFKKSMSDYTTTVCMDKENNRVLTTEVHDGVYGSYREGINGVKSHNSFSQVKEYLPESNADTLKRYGLSSESLRDRINSFESRHFNKDVRNFYFERVANYPGFENFKKSKYLQETFNKLGGNVVRDQFSDESIVEFVKALESPITDKNSIKGVVEDYLCFFHVSSKYFENDLVPEVELEEVEVEAFEEPVIVTLEEFACRFPYFGAPDVEETTSFARVNTKVGMTAVTWSDYYDNDKN